MINSLQSRLRNPFGEKAYAVHVEKIERDRVKRGHLKLVVGAGNRLHAAMQGVKSRKFTH